MQRQTEMYVLAGAGGVVGFAVVLLVAVLGVRATPGVALPVAGAAGLAAAAATYLWVRNAADRPDPLLG